jgi:hypothetical protein
MREGSVDAPTRHPVEWKTEAFWDRDSLNDELARVYDVLPRLQALCQPVRLVPYPF